VTTRENYKQTMTMTDSEQHSLVRSIVLHLLPGLLILLFYIITAPVAQEMGFPSLMALLVAIGVVLIPFELGYLLYDGTKRNKKLSLKGILQFRESIPSWQYIVFGFLLFMWLGLIFGVVADPIDKIIIKRLFGWIPDWFFLFGPANQLTGYSKSALVITAIFNVVLNGIAGPVTEELYFRGYLLPRLSRLEGWAPLVNVLLFSIYHFFTPWQNPIRIIALLPMVYMVWWKRNIYLGMIVHCAGNMVGAIGMLVMALGHT
jgi:membrane protease YdiL (CAAX protease family)